jgi:DNA replication factor GINS
MNLEGLWKILDKERSSPVLQKLPTDFYKNAGIHVQELEREKEKMNETKKMMIEDELMATRRKIEDVFYKRMSKIANLASTNLIIEEYPKFLTREEKDVFESILRCVKDGKERILDPILQKNIKEEEVNTDTKSDECMRNSQREFCVARILEDMPTFVGIDGRNYTIKKEDVVALPKENAEILYRRGLALPIERR